jgi:hypothetical protein
MQTESRSGFVLSTTITETILLLFFLLLLLLTYLYATWRADVAKLEGELARSTQEAARTAALQAELYALKNRIESLLAHLPPGKVPDARQVLISLSALEAEIAQKRDEQEALARDVEALKMVEAKLAKALEAKGLSGAELQKAKEAGRCETALAERRDLAALKRQAAQSASELKEANRRNRDLQDQYQACVRASGGGKSGDRVACWKDADNRIEYVFEVQLADKGLQVRRKWTDGREGEMERFSRARALAGTTLSMDEFLVHTRGLFLDSEEKGCRYYVVVSGNRSSMNPARFRDFQRVQEHFYIYDNVR